MVEDQRPPEEQTADGNAFAQFAGLGFQFAAVVAVFAYAGIWLDRRFGTSPLFILVAVFAGAGGAFYSMIHRIRDITAGQGRR